jgi:hypothetical protein
MDQFKLSPEDLPLTGAAKKDRDRLTFGVEFEFALAMLTDGNEDPSPEDGRIVVGINEGADNDPNPFLASQNSAIRHVAETLTGAGIKSEPVVNGATSYKPDDPKVWLVKSDVSIVGPDTAEADMYTWFTIEITTPPFYFSSQALDIVKQVCEILTTTYRINCNQTAGVHVHVGNATKGFSFDILSNLYAMLWTFEPQISEIHPYHRTEDNYYCASFRKASQLAEQIGSREPMDVAEIGLDIQLDFQIMRELGEAVDPDVGRMAYNMENIMVFLGGFATNPTKNTIEFRQHESTLDPERSTNWARFCVGCLEFADTVPQDALEKFLKKHIRDSPTDFNIGQVLTALGMPYLAAWFTQKVAEQKVKDKAMKKAEDDHYAAMGPIEGPKKKASSNSSISQNIARKKWNSKSRSKSSSKSSSWD